MFFFVFGLYMVLSFKFFKHFMDYGFTDGSSFAGLVWVGLEQKEMIGLGR